MSDTIWAAYIGGGFVIAAALIGGLFTLRQKRRKADGSSQSKASNSYNITAGDVGPGAVVGHNNIVQQFIDNDPKAKAALEVLIEQLDAVTKSEQEKTDIIRDQQATIARLVQQKRSSTNPGKYDEALRAIAKDDKSLADELLAESLDSFEKETLKAAEIYRERGALWFGSDTQKALAAYKRATEFDPSSLSAWNQLGHLYYRVGELDKAISAYNTILDLSREIYWVAVATGNLGLIYRVRGELSKAERYHQKALELNESSGRQEGIATQCGNLGLVYIDLSELEKAEKYVLKALTVEEILKREKGIASQYGNLGLIYLMRTNKTMAEEFFRKSLMIYRKINYAEGISKQHGNLGLVYLVCEQLDKAEEYLQKSLTLDEKLNHGIGMANQYGNLSVVYMNRTELDKAEKYQLMSLKINEKLQNKKNIAGNYENLGEIYKKRGDDAVALSYWKKSFSLYKEIGMKQMAERVQSWIDGLETE